MDVSDERDAPVLQGVGRDEVSVHDYMGDGARIKLNEKEKPQALR